VFVVVFVLFVFVVVAFPDIDSGILWDFFLRFCKK